MAYTLSILILPNMKSSTCSCAGMTVSCPALQALLELLPEVQRLVSSLPPDTLAWRLQVMQEGCR